MRGIVLVVLGLICLVLLAQEAFAPAASVTPAAPAQPVTEQFSGQASFTGGKGNYIVACRSCIATVTTNRGGWCVGQNLPTSTVTQNGVMSVGDVYSTTDANGSWIVEGKVVNSFGAGGDSSCTATPKFTVIMTEGGTITKLP